MKVLNYCKPSVCALRLNRCARAWEKADSFELCVVCVCAVL